MGRERIEALRVALSRANNEGELALVWSFTISHAQMRLRIECTNGPDVWLTLDGVARALFQPRWRDIDLSFSMDSAQTVLRDTSAGFEVRCGVILVGNPDDPETALTGR
jgi:hypothetical protein